MEAARARRGLATVSGERVRDELSAVARHRRLGAAFRDLAVGGALAVVLPELDGLRGVARTRITTWTCSVTRWRRSPTCAGVVGQLGGEGYLTPPDEAGLPGVAPLVPVSWAVLLHDIGKPAVRMVDDDGRVIFWHHDEVGGAWPARSRLACASATASPPTWARSSASTCASAFSCASSRSRGGRSRATAAT